MNKIIKIILILVGIILLIVIRMNFPAIKEFMSATLKNKEVAPKTQTVQDALFNASLKLATSSDTVNIKAHDLLNLAVGAATTSSEIKIENCLSNPVSIKVEYGDEISFKNTGKRTETLFFTRLREMSIAPGKELKIKSSDLVYPKKPGTLSTVNYTCGDVKRSIGFITIQY